jgi:hypothetical protein
VRTLFEGGPLDGGYLDVEAGVEFLRTFSQVEASAYYLAGSIEPPEIRVYTYKRWEVRYPGDGRVEIRYCLLGRKPLV